MLAGVIVDQVDPAMIGVVHFLTIIGVALAAFGGGWVGGLVAGLILIVVMGAERQHEAGEVLLAMVDYPLVMLLTLAARNRLLAFRRSESRLRALIGAIHDVIFVLDRDGMYVEILPTGGPLLYKPAHDLAGKLIHEIFDRKQADFFVARIRQALDEGPIDCDYCLSVDGRDVWFSASVSPLTESTVIWVARDMTARKLAEDALEAARGELERRVEERTRELRESEERFRRVFDEAEEIIFTLSNEGFLTSINPAFQRILGWPRETWIGKPFNGLIPAEHREAAGILFDTLSREGSIPLSRIQAIARNGSRVTLEITAVEQMAGGRRIGFQGIGRDITERERAEERLRRSERQLAEAQRAAGMGSWEHDLIAGTMWWSEELFRIVGVAPTVDPLPWSAFVELVAEEDRPKLQEAEHILLARGEHEWEMGVRLNDGTEKTVWCSGSVVSNPGHGILRVIGTLKDVTERRLSERRLAESEERFRLVTLATTDAIWDTDLRANRSWLSEGFQQFGYTPGWIENSYEWWLDSIHQADRERVRAGRAEAIETGQVSWSSEYQFRRADGTYAYILDRVHLVRGAGKEAVRLLGAFMDLTERKQLENQLEQAKRVSSLGRVAASIAHEFNNVLMGIQPNVEVIQRSSPKGLRQPTDNILRAVRHGKRVTDEILRFTRPVEPELQCVYVPEFFQQWREQIEPMLGPAIDLQFDMASDDIHVLADASQLTQVLTNLALNARDAMQESGGKITVSAHLSKSFGSFPFGVVKSPDRFVHFSVQDQGCGIARERLSHIFEPLFTTKKSGIGLGLAIAYQIVTRHEGHIFVESEPGSGTAFHIFIPATSPMVHDLPAEGPKAPVQIRRIVLVEDEAAVASGIAMLLEMEGISVEIAGTGRESIPAIERTSPDVVILDIGLPDMDGVGVYLEIERRWPSLPVLFSSGHGDSAKLEKYLARPNVGFILKPYDFDAMHAALDELVGAGVAAAS